MMKIRLSVCGSDGLLCMKIFNINILKSVVVSLYKYDPYNIGSSIQRILYSNDKNKHLK